MYTISCNPPGAILIIIKLIIAKEIVTIIIGSNTLKVLATAGGTCGGILISNLLVLDNLDINSPTSKPTIIATNKPCAPIYFIAKWLAPSIAT